MRRPLAYVVAEDSCLCRKCAEDSVSSILIGVRESGRIAAGATLKDIEDLDLLEELGIEPVFDEEDLKMVDICDDCECSLLDGEDEDEDD
jgi:hypothetical protein